jgi:hypothetical protein
MTSLYHPNSRILWEGPSAFDGAPIVVILTGITDRSANEKTGDELQTWILRQDVKPNDATKTGESQSVCGNCQHQPIYNNTCYVRVYQAPRNIWSTYKNGRYNYFSQDDLNLIKGRVLRMGSYGDPAMVPNDVWSQLLNVCSAHTGYTHQWRQAFAESYRGILQASCDGLQDYLDATAHGWRTFLVKPADAEAPAGTVHCAASAERGKKTTCALCHLCDGDSANVVINGHGSRGGKVSYLN